MTVVLKNEFLELVLDPERGTSILACFWRRRGKRFPLMPDARKPGTGLKAASFLMVPYSNRIENGVFTFQGRSHSLKRAGEHAIHGDVRQRPWRIETAGDRGLECSFDSRLQADCNWPWPFSSRVEYRLDGSALISRLELRNEGSEPMPAGLGWHPYFSRNPSRPGEEVRVGFRVRQAYPDDNGTRIPSGPPRSLKPEENFSRERVLPPNLFLDTCFRGFEGRASIAWPESGIRLEIETGEPCGHLVVYNPPGKPWFALEPVSNANNGVNLLAAGDRGAGVAVLEPGQEMAAESAIKVGPISAAEK